MSSGAMAISAGALHSMVLKRDGSVWVAGSNQNGQLGDDSKHPTRIFEKLKRFVDGPERDMIMESHGVILMIAKLKYLIVISTYLPASL